MKSLFLLSALFLSASVLAAPPGAPTNPHAGMMMPGMNAPAVQLPQQGKVLNVIDVPQYTYIEVTQGKKTLWLAATTVKVKKGDIIRFDDGMTMNNFYSKTLKRKFPSIAFVNNVTVGGKK